MANETTTAGPSADPIIESVREKLLQRSRTGIAKYGVTLYPFFLDGVALDPAFSQPDGLHPTASGVAEVVKRIMPDVEALVQRISQHKTAAN